MTSPNLNYGVIRSFIARHRINITLRLIARDWLRVVCIGLISLSLASALFAFFPWILLPLLLDLVIMGMVGFAGWSALRHLVMHPFTAAQTARSLESTIPSTHPLLSIALQLGADQGQPYSADLVDETITRAVESLAHYPRRLPNLVSRRLLISSSGAALLYVILSLTLPGSLQSFWSLPFTYLDRSSGVVRPGNCAVARGASVVLSYRPSKSTHPSCRLTVTSTKATASMLLRPDADGTFRYRMDSLRQTVSYQFHTPGSSLAVDTISVVPPPTLRSLQITVAPPPYTRLAARALPEGQGSFGALAGSAVRLTLSSHFKLKAAWMVRGADSLPLSVAGLQATTSLTLDRGGAYTFALIDSFGQRSDSLPAFFMDVTPDLPPICRIVRPGVNRSLAPSQRETLSVEAADDFGITAFALSWRKGHDGSVDHSSYPQQSDTAKLAQLFIDWDLVPLGLYPGDTLFYWASAFDNHPVANVANSDSFWFRVPGFEEIQAGIMHHTDHAADELAKVREHQTELTKSIGDLKESPQSSSEPSWEQKEALTDVQKQVASQRDSLAGAVKSLDEAIRQMTDQGMRSDQLLDKMNKVREAVEQLLKGYSDSLLSKSQQPAKSPDFKDIQQAVERLKSALPELEQQLDNTLKYLEALRKDQERTAIAERLSKMADDQDRIAASDHPAALKAQQQNLLDRASQAHSDINKQMNRDADEGLFKPSDLPSLDKYDSLLHAMQRMMGSGSMPQMSDQTSMSQAMRSLSNEMNSLSSTARMAQMMHERDELLDMANDALNLAQWQREAEQGDGSADRSPQERAADQQTLAQGLRESSEKLDSLRMVPPDMLRKLALNYSTAQKAMQRMLGAMAGQPGGSTASAVGGLNGLAAALLQAGAAMAGPSSMPGGGGGGLMDLLRQLSGKQGAINSATADLLRQLLSQQQGGASGGSGQSSDAAKRRAQQAQQALADQLKGLSDKFGKQAGGGMDNRLRDLEKEAREIARMFENPQSELRDRQDRFLSRLLQTTLSLNREGEGKQERKSKSAQTVFSPSAGAENGEILSGTDAFYRLRMRAFQGNIPREYRPAVKAYFDSLGVLLLKE